LKEKGNIGTFFPEGKKVPKESSFSAKIVFSLSQGAAVQKLFERTLRVLLRMIPLLREYGGGKRSVSGLKICLRELFRYYLV